jgi:hypothetical protein
VTTNVSHASQENFNILDFISYSFPDFDNKNYYTK